MYDIFSQKLQVFYDKVLYTCTSVTSVPMPAPHMSDEGMTRNCGQYNFSLAARQLQTRKICYNFLIVDVISRLLAPGLGYWCGIVILKNEGFLSIHKTFIGGPTNVWSNLPKTVNSDKIILQPSSSSSYELDFVFLNYCPFLPMSDDKCPWM